MNVLRVRAKAFYFVCNDLFRVSEIVAIKDETTRISPLYLLS